MDEKKQPTDTTEAQTVQPEVVSTETPIATPSVPDYQLHTERQWPALIIYTVLALAVAVLVVFGGRWIYHKVHHSNKPTPAPASNNLPPQPFTAANPPSSQSSSGSSSSPSSSSSNSASNSSSTVPSNNSQPAKNTSLPNTGPGDVVAIFVTASLAAAGAHYIYNLRKQNF